MIKVLWFEHTLPGRYKDVGKVQNGWTDSLERIVQTISDIKLGVAFAATDGNQDFKEVDGISYYPVKLNYSALEKIRNKYSYRVYQQKLIEACLDIVDSFKPDIIQVFGAEFPYAQVAMHTRIPVVIHILGAAIPYMNAYYPPGVSYSGKFFEIPLWNVKRLIGHFLWKRIMKSWTDIEKETWEMIPYYMGRTKWDRRLSSVLHPGREYYCVNEALRTEFLTTKKVWNFSSDKKLRLISTGCGSYWKGPDMLLKVAKILTELNIDFEWILCGKMPDSIKREFEKKCHTTYENNNIKFVGFVDANKLIDLLCSSSFYVHTAYIENSPNSVCEAQLLGVPIVSTNVGGISTLVRDGVDGVLVPSNDPYQMASVIIDLQHKKDILEKMSENTRAYALSRHSDSNIREELYSAYIKILGL